MVASALQSRIRYLTKHAGNLPAKYRQTEVIRVSRIGFAVVRLQSKKKGGPERSRQDYGISTPLELNLKFELQHASGYRRSLEVSIRAARRSNGALNVAEGTSIGQIVVGVRETWMV
jgi:hypothetical protein